MGDIGPTQYLTGLNGRVRSITKATGAADGVLNLDFDVFFSGVRTAPARPTRACATTGAPAAGSCSIISVGVPNRFLVAMSDTATITGGTVVGLLRSGPTRARRRRGRRGLVPRRLPVARPRRRRAVHRRQPVLRRRPRHADLRLDLGLRREQDGARSGGTLAGRAVRRGAAQRARAAGIFTPQGVDNFDSNTSTGYVIGVDNTAFGQLVLRRIANPAGTPSISGDITINVPATHSRSTSRTRAARCRSTASTTGCCRRSSATAGCGRRTRSRSTAPRRRRRHGGGRTGIRWYELQNLDADAVGGAVGHGVRPRRQQPGQLLDGRHHAQRPGPRGARHVAGRRGDRS